MRVQLIFVILLLLSFLLSCTKERLETKTETTQTETSAQAAKARLTAMLALERSPYRSRTEILQIAQQKLGVKGQDALHYQYELTNILYIYP